MLRASYSYKLGKLHFCARYEPYLFNIMAVDLQKSDKLKTKFDNRRTDQFGQGYKVGDIERKFFYL